MTGPVGKLRNYRPLMPQTPATPAPCSTGGSTNHWSTGVSLNAATVNPLTSGGGEVWGGNTQSFPGEEGWTQPVTNHYSYGGHGEGLDVGVSAQSVVARGSGNWAGTFHSVEASYSLFTGSVFWTPGSGGWIGASFGVGVGLPGLAYETTNYTCTSTRR